METGNGKDKEVLIPSDDKSQQGDDKVTTYGLLLPKGYKVERTNYIKSVNTDKHQGGTGGNDEYDPGLIWYQHYYKVMDINGNEIIGNFTISAGDEKPMTFYQEGATQQDCTIEVDQANCKPEIKTKAENILKQAPILRSSIDYVPQQLDDRFDLFYFTADSVTAIYEDQSVNRKRGTFVISFSYNGTQKITVKLPLNGNPYTEGSYSITY